MTVNVYVNRS